MCGLTGAWSGRGGADLTATVGAMTAALAHRGPDGDGRWGDPAAGLVLGHRRLSILDLSPAGAQPMASACGRYVIAFNGEIYNHLRLRAELGSAVPGWRGSSDTETLLAAIARWGLVPTLRRLAGMFAFALWDRHEGCLTLVRDRMGEKPLYYGFVGRALVFGSELKSLCAAAGFDRAIDRGALHSYLRHGCVPAPLTIYRNARKLPPAHMASFRAPDRFELAEWWSLSDVAARGERERAGGAPGEEADRLEGVLREVVGSQMLSDVPLGAFLSGGIDSSLIAALMCTQAPAAAVRTFSIGFEAGRFNEAGAARSVAAHLGTDHTELTITEDDALAVVPTLPGMFDEPFADSSAIPTAILCRLTRQAVTVALSGDGGDEVFGGYNRHVLGPRLWARIERLPPALRRALVPATAAVQRLSVGRRAEAVAAVARKLGLPATAVDRFAKFGDAAGRADSFAAFYRELVSTWTEPDAAMSHPGDPLAEPAWPPLAERGEQLMLADALGYLPNDILVKVDRCAMAASLETRAPFLDARVVEAAWRLPFSAKIDGGRGKAILRDILHRHVPRELVDRPKQGFAVPLDDWLRGRLRDWAESLLSPDALRDADLFDADTVTRVWGRHTSGTENAGARLWAVLMAQAWAGQDRAMDQAMGRGAATAAARPFPLPAAS